LQLKKNQIDVLSIEVAKFAERKVWFNLLQWANLMEHCKKAGEGKLQMWHRKQF
jgi:hypothetical protein